MSTIWQAKTQLLTLLALGYRNVYPCSGNLSRAETMDRLFARFDKVLTEKSYLAMSGQIMDASIVAAPKQRNTDGEKRAIKEGRIPEGGEDNPAKRRHIAPCLKIGAIVNRCSPASGMSTTHRQGDKFMSMLQEFKDFAVKGNVVDMGVGIVIGAAFTSIVNSLVADIINPIIGVITGGIDFSNLFINLGEGDYASLSAAQAAGAPTLNYGLFINAVISFLIVSFVLFIIIKNVNRLKKLAEDEPKAPKTPEPTAEVKLLTEIRDALKKA